MSAAGETAIELVELSLVGTPLKATTNAAGGNAGTITLDATNGTTPTITLAGNLTAKGGNAVGTDRAAGSGGAVRFKDAVLLNAALAIHAASSIAFCADATPSPSRSP